MCTQQLAVCRLVSRSTDLVNFCETLDDFTVTMIITQIPNHTQPDRQDQYRQPKYMGFAYIASQPLWRGGGGGGVFNVSVYDLSCMVTKEVDIVHNQVEK